MTIDTQFDIAKEWKPTHYTKCFCGRKLELYEFYNGVQLYFQRVKNCECGKNYRLEDLFNAFGCKGY